MGWGGTRPDVTRTRERLRGLGGALGGQYCTGSPREAHLRDIQEQMTKKDTRTAGWLEGEEDKHETTGSSSASLQGCFYEACRQARVLEGEKQGVGVGGRLFQGWGTEPGSWQLLEPQLPACPGTAAAPMSMSTGQETQSWEHRPSPQGHLYDPQTHTHSPTRPA